MMNFIDSDCYCTHDIDVFQFPGGEWHAKVPKWPHSIVHIEAKLRTWDDVGKLLAVADALRQQDVRVYLFAAYFPGLRQDRSDSRSPLTAELMGRILSAAIRHVTVVDPHSAKGVQLVQRHMTVKVIEPVVFLKDLIDLKPDYVLAPDAGAAHRANRVAELFESGFLQAEKTRDFSTGQLSGFAVPNIPLGCKRLLIPDDICDGGGTFIGLLGEIRKQYSGPVDLYVTHGIFSKGLQVLEGFDNVYTTDSFYDNTVAGPDAKTIELFPYYLGGLRP